VNEDNQTPSLGLVKRILSWPSGAIPGILAKCPTEQGYYCGLGTLVWITATLAGTGMALMLTHTTGSSSIAIAGGGFWSLCVLNLDRFILLATHETTGWKRLMPVSRVLLSLCLAIIIGEHVVQFIFHSEIADQLEQEQLDGQRENYRKALAGFPEIPVLNDEKARKEKEIDNAKTEVVKWSVAYIGEAEGSIGSHVRGKGPLYAQKRTNYENALKEQQKLETELSEIQKRLDAENVRLQAAVKVANDAKAGDRGFLASHRALFEVIKSDKTLLVLYVVIVLAMILFEITPIFSKLGGRTRLHDVLAAKQTGLYQNEEVGRIDRAANAADHMGRLEADTIRELIDAIKSGGVSGLPGEKAAMAEAIKVKVYGRVMSHVAPDESAQTTKEPAELADSPFDPGNLVPVMLNIAEEGVKEPRMVTLFFAKQRESLLGSHLIELIPGLDHLKQRIVAGGQILNPATQLTDYRLMNGHGEPIKPEVPLFSQISDDTVYLSHFEPMVSHATN